MGPIASDLDQIMERESKLVWSNVELAEARMIKWLDKCIGVKIIATE